MAARIDAGRAERSQVQTEKRERAEAECTDEQRRRPAVHAFIEAFDAEKRALTAAHESAAASHAASASAAADTQLALAEDAVGRMRQLLAHASIDLPPYEIRSAQRTIDEATAKTVQLREAAAPKKKFAFKNRAVVKPAANLNADVSGVLAATGTEDSSASSSHAVAFGAPAPSLPTVSAAAEASASAAAAAAVSSHDAASAILARYSAINLHHISGVDVYRSPGSLSGQDVWISDATDATIALCDHLGALRIDRVRRCRIYVGAVAGSVHLEDCVDCVLVLASRQIRIHTAQRCDFYLHVQSNPIIEHSSALRFAPYCLRYAERAAHAAAARLDEARNLWEEVQDFNWLKTQHSPNWESIAPAARCAPIEIDAQGGVIACVATASGGAASAAVAHTESVDEEF
jgi:hypothetical protein